MSEWTRDITAKDFQKWMEVFVANASDAEWEHFYECIEDTVLEMESEDYFGTEGFDKRFG